MSPTDPNEIGKIIRSFRSKQSTGQDEINMKLLKQLQASCSLPLSILINMSLGQGVVPDTMKLAKVIPIYKAKSKESLNNYRPISLLSNISKILEKVMHKRLCSFMNRHHLLCESQYGFRSNHSTVDAITEFVTKILPSLDKREICLLTYLDLSRAFNMCIP